MLLKKKIIFRQLKKKKILEILEPITNLSNQSEEEFLSINLK